MNTNEKKQLILFTLLTALLFNVWTLPRYTQFKRKLRTIETMTQYLKDDTHELYKDLNAEWRIEQLLKELRKEMENKITHTINKDNSITIEIMKSSSISIVSNSLNLFTEYDFIIKELNFITLDGIPRILIVLDSFQPMAT